MRWRARPCALLADVISQGVQDARRIEHVSVRASEQTRMFRAQPIDGRGLALRADLCMRKVRVDNGAHRHRLGKQVDEGKTCGSGSIEIIRQARGGVPLERGRRIDHLDLIAIEQVVHRILLQAAAEQCG